MLGPFRNGPSHKYELKTVSLTNQRLSLFSIASAELELIGYSTSSIVVLAIAIAPDDASNHPLALLKWQRQNRICPLPLSFHNTPFSNRSSIARALSNAGAECDAGGSGLRGMSFKSRLAAFVARVRAMAERQRSASSKWPAATANSISCDGLGS